MNLGGFTSATLVTAVPPPPAPTDARWWGSGFCFSQVQMSNKARVLMGVTLIGRAQAIDSPWANHCGPEESALWLADLKGEGPGGEPLSPQEGDRGSHPQKEIGGFCGNGGKQTLEMRITLLYSCLAHCHLWCLPTGVLTAWDALPCRASPLNLRWTFQASRSLFLPTPRWPRAFPLHFLIFLLDHST